MDHVVLLFAHLIVVVSSRNENEVARLHLFGLECDGQGVILVSLVPAIELKAEVLPQVVDHLPRQSTAVQIQRCLVMFLAFFPVSGRIGNSEVLFGGINELLSELVLEQGILSILESFVGNIIPIPNVLLLGLLEALEVSLKIYLGRFEFDVVLLIRLRNHLNI